MVDGRSLMLPRHTQPERDLQAMLNQLQLCRRNRRLASNPLNPLSEKPPVPSRFVVETFH